MSHIIVKLKVKQETNMSSPEIGRLIKEQVSTMCVGDFLLPRISAKRLIDIKFHLSF